MPKLPDWFIERCGYLYRFLCGKNDVLIAGGHILTFEAFLMKEANLHQLGVWSSEYGKN